MAPVVWLILLMAFVPSIPLPGFLRNSFPLNLMQGNADDARPLRFVRIIVASALFGGIWGLLVGLAVMAAQYLATTVTS